MIAVVGVYVVIAFWAVIFIYGKIQEECEGKCDPDSVGVLSILTGAAWPLSLFLLLSAVFKKKG